MASGPQAIRLSRYSQSEIEDGSTAPVIECSFPAPKARKTKRKATQNDDDDDPDAEPSAPTQRPRARAKRQAAKRVFDDEKDFARGSDDELDLAALHESYQSDHDSDLGELLLDNEPAPPAKSKKRTANGSNAKPKRTFKSEEVLEVSD